MWYDILTGIRSACAQEEFVCQEIFGMTKIAFGILILLLALSESLMLAPAEEVPSTENPEAGSADGALIVKKISFEGVKNTPEDFFAIYIQTKVGEEISPDRLSKDIKNLYKNTGFFSDFGDAGESPIKVEVETAEGGGLEVTYKLIESPKIESVKIIGNEKLKTGKIQDAITLKPSEIYSDQRRWESARAILKVYKEKGYHLASIKTDTNVDQDTNTIEVTFEISEGERIKIREINFIGNDRISAKTLSKKIKTRVDKNFDESLLDQDLTLLRHYYQDQGYAIKIQEINFVGNRNISTKTLSKKIKTRVGKYFDENLLDEDMILLRHYYQDQGFAQIEVEGHEHRLTADSTGLTIDIPVDEGPEYIIGAYDIKIHHSEKPAFSEDKIRDMLDPIEGEIFDRGAFQESIEKIQKAYQDKGYLLAGTSPTPHFNETTGVVDIVLNINEGDVIIIEKVEIDGLEKTKKDVIQRELDRLNLKTGEFLDVKSLRKARQKFFQMGPFIRNVDFKPTPNALGENSRDLKVDITEQIEVEGYEYRLTADNTGLIIDISVDEGPEYIIGAYDIRILHSKKPAFSEDKIRDMLNPVEGEIFDRGTFQESIEKVQKAYQGKGFLLAEMSPTPDFDETTGVVDIALNVNEGDVIIIENVEIDGLEKTKENVIQRELDEANLKTGEFLDVKSLRKARQKLFQMGPFIRNIDIKPTPNASGENSRDLKVDITETPSTGMFSLGGGYGTEGGIYGVAEVGENNLFGRAYRVHLKGELGTSDRHTAELRFNTPWIFGSPTRLNASLYNTRRLHRFDSQYYQDRGLDQSIFTRKGGAVTVGRSVAQDIDVSIRFKNEYTHDNRGNPLFNIGLGNRASLNGLNDRIFPDELSAAFENNGDPLSDDATISVETQSHEWLIEDFGDDANAKRQYVIQPDGETSNLNVYRFGQHPYNRSVRSLTFFLSRDTRDYLTSIYEPVSGSLNTVSYEYAGGFLKADSKFQRYTLDSSWFTNTWSNHVIAAHARGGYLESRASDDWFLHYERFRLGGIDTIRGYNENQIGPARENGYGGNKVLFANFEYRIPLGSQLTGVAFFDVGQVWDELEPNVFENINLKKGAGVGIRFNLFGMLARLEWGYGFDRQRGQFHWTIGPGF
jgi:outer membrane protein assembly complex protein YaeT